MSEQEQSLINEEEEASGLGAVSKDEIRDLEIPAGFDKEKITNLKEQKEKVVQKINSILQGGVNKPKAKPLFFSFYIPPQEKKRDVGERWIDDDGKEWEQRNGYRISIPKIDHEELERDGFLMPRFCPRCNKPLTKQLDKKMWKFNGFCMDCTAEWETQMQIDGTYAQYERNRIMSNIRSFYHDVMDGLDDYVNSLDATYVNEFGDVERWDKVNKPMIKSMILHDLRLLAEDFEKNFGEQLEK